MLKFSTPTLRRLWLGIALSGSSYSAIAGLNIFATVPEWGALAQEIGGAQVSVYTATTALQDPHRIDAKPSLIARARSADVVIATGAELEIGWLPLVLRETGNPKIQPGQPGYFEAACQIRLLEVPARLDRADGDVHPGGNPHIQLDPRNILKVGEALSQRLAELDPANAKTYQAQFASFKTRWQQNISRWEQQAAPLKGQAVWVQHKAFPYLTNWLGMKELGALEPKPGVEPTSSHLREILQRQQATPAKMIIRAQYQREAPAQWLAQQAGIPSVTLAFTVGGNPDAKDLTSLFDDTVKKLLAGLR